MVLYSQLKYYSFIRNSFLKTTPSQNFKALNYILLSSRTIYLISKFYVTEIIMVKIKYSKWNIFHFIMYIVITEHYRKITKNQNLRLLNCKFTFFKYNTSSKYKFNWNYIHYIGNIPFKITQNQILSVKLYFIFSTYDITY